MPAWAFYFYRDWHWVGHCNKVAGWVRQQVDFTNVNAVKSLRLQRGHKEPR